MRIKYPDPILRIYQAAKSSSAVLLLIGGIGVATLGLVVLAGFWAGAESDSAAFERQRDLVTRRLREQVEQVAKAIDQVGSGYMSLLSADLGDQPRPGANIATSPKSLDPVSAEAITVIVTAVFGYDQAFVVDGTGQLAMRSDVETEKRFRWIKPLLLPLLQDRPGRRRAAADRASDSVSRQDDHRRGAFAELMRLEGRPTIAGVAQISRGMEPGAEEKDPPLGEMRYLIAIRFLDGEVLDNLSREQGLNGARYARSADPDGNEVAVQIDAGATGDPIGFIVWSPDLPGSRVIGRLLPALVTAALIIVVLFLLLLVRLRSSLIELKRSEVNARHLARHDVLTALPNRAFFSACLEEHLAKAEIAGHRSAIALIDLDRFKAVNDSFGHAAGDELIRNAAERMRNVIRPTDILARLGGDEFALLLRNIGGDDTLLEGLADALLAELKRPFHLRSGEVVAHVGGSIGVSRLPASGGNASEILRHADAALYEAKHQGRGRSVIFQPAMEHGRNTRETLKSELRALLGVLPGADRRDDAADDRIAVSHEETGKLELYFQTIHRVSEGNRASGAEALVRWHHPKHGLLTPDRFISIAEEGGLIEALGRWVLLEACQAATNWPSATFVAVNVSPLQLRAPGFHEEVGRILYETGLTPSRLELEVTESALIADSGHVTASLERLRQRGTQISLDDFGTGYSSLSHLMQFRIDRIKIDRSFVSLLGARAEGAAIVSAIVSLGRTLGISTTAEGVETDAQCAFLAAVGCTDLQGYLFSRPMPLHDLQRLDGFSAISEDRQEELLRIIPSKAL
ncbi:putative bifunctional diguanylate cyclase/phosphodiesterase [Jiella pacifica]|uniref:EAL domain-containing protein n=1 Tax=Jiella pacifica TaxID=2696469 RepID=A0A6N9TCG2_9HYPH|nr:EAL domain-containing protein [Jiella pacifica]NDW07915.1 EAL domain-containing protein [Jiella pacifica]